MRYLKIRSKNHTANGLRRTVRSNKLAVLRLGSTTPTQDIFPNVRDLTTVTEINTVEGCKISGNKIKMKEAFDEAGVIHSEWKPMQEFVDAENIEEVWNTFPAIIKHKNSCKGNGIYYIQSLEELRTWIREHRTELNLHIIEKYYTYNREYRLHVTQDGCFYTCRKMLRHDAQERWHRHDNNSVWIVEENDAFNKPTNWDQIVAECVKALRAVKLDIAAIDVKVQSAKEGRDPKFIILETNSAPSLGERTTLEYIAKLTSILNA